jgi:H/ACA ribonucleoprotein complex subunit 4
LGDATKALSALLLGPKEYLCVARIHDPVPEHVAENTFSQFVGEIYQRPPQRSSVRRTTRTREIYELELIERVGNLILLRVLCEAGTYIRKLVYDAGEIMIVGATMAELRRTKVCQLGEGDLVRMHDLFESKATFDETGSDSKIKKLVRPVEEALVFLPQIRIRDSAVESICQGAQLAIPGIVSFSKDLKKGDIVRVLSLKGELIAIAETSLSSEEIQKADHGIAAVTRRVIMRTGTYPKMWKSKDDETLDVSMELLKKSVLDSLEREDRTQV